MDDMLISYDAVVDIINGEYCACCDETEEVLGNILEELKRLKESSGSK